MARLTKEREAEIRAELKHDGTIDGSDTEQVFAELDAVRQELADANRIWLQSGQHIGDLKKDLADSEQRVATWKLAAECNANARDEAIELLLGAEAFLAAHPVDSADQGEKP